MKTHHKMLLVVLLLGTFAGGWLCGGGACRTVPGGAGATVGQTGQPRGDGAARQEQRIDALTKQLQEARQLAGEQRQMLREDALQRSLPAIDEQFTLFPARFPQGDWRPAETVFEDCWFQALDGIRLHGWYARHAEPQAAILFLHGNAGNVTHRAVVCAYLREHLRASVLLFDYRGYGRSEGRPTIDGMLRDARAARDYLAASEQIGPGSVVLLGRSLGGALAVELAAEDGARGVILESTFSSLRDVAGVHYPPYLVDLLVKDRLNSADRIAGYHGPLLQSHGDGDRLVPFASGKRLFDCANEPKTFVRIPGADHNDDQSPEYYRQLKQFLATLPQ